MTRSEACSPPADGSDSRDKPKLYRLQLSVTEVGTEKFDDSSIQVRGRGRGGAVESRLTAGGAGGVSVGPPAPQGPGLLAFPRDMGLLL